MLRTNIENQILINPTLAIKTGSSPIVKSSNDFLYTLNGSVYAKAASDMSAIPGTLATAYKKAYAFVIDSSGTITTVAGTAVSTSSAITSADMPVVPLNKTLIGLVVIVNATGSTFTGGTTALDTSNLTVYYTNVIPTGL